MCSSDLKMTILESVQDQKVVHELHFIEPFEDTATVTFTIAASGDQSTLVWAMDGKQNLFSKTMCLFSSMDAMIAPDFERGLAELGPKVEADAKSRLGAEKAAAEKAAAEKAAAEAAVSPPTP